MRKLTIVFALIALSIPLVLQAAVETRWLSLQAGTELSSYQDKTAGLFHEASGRTTSLYASMGGSRWVVAASFGRQEISQANWEFSGLRRSIWLRRMNASGIAIELKGSRVSEGPGPGSWSLGAGLGLPIGHSSVSRSELLLGGGSGQGSFQVDELILHDRINQLELRLLHTRGALRLRASILATSHEDDRRQALLLRCSGKRGKLGWHATALRGGLHAWLDGERLVIHDNREELRGILAAGLGFDLGKRLVAHASAGLEQVDGHSSRWFYVGIGWTKRTWVIR